MATPNKYEIECVKESEHPDDERTVLVPGSSKNEVRVLGTTTSRTTNALIALMVASLQRSNLLLSCSYGRPRRLPYERLKNANADDFLHVDVTPCKLQSFLQNGVQMIFFPILIILGGLPESGKTKFLKNILRIDEASTKPQSVFSQNVIVASKLQSPSTKPAVCADVSHDASLYYSFLSGIRYKFKIDSIVATFESICDETGMPSKAFDNEILQKTAFNICKYMHKKSRKQEEIEDTQHSKRLIALENALHRGVNVAYLWDITVNRTVMRFLECFRGHLYNCSLWLFVDLDRDIDKLYDPPDNSFAMKWRSRLHYLLRSSCLSESPSNQPKRARLCRIIAIHNDLDETSLQSKIQKLREEAENAASQYGLVQLFNFDIFPIKVNDSKEKANDFFLQCLQGLLPQNIPLLWVFFRIALTDQQSIFIKQKEVYSLANDLKIDLNVKEFLKFYTSFGSILDVSLVDHKDSADDEYIILDPAKFLNKLCSDLLSKKIKFGIITLAEAYKALGNEHEQYLDVLTSVGLVAKIRRERIYEVRDQFGNDDFVYYMSVIRQGKPDEQSLPDAVQFVGGVRSPAMNMQIAFTKQILELLPNTYLVPCEQLNVTCFKFVTDRVQNNIIEIKFVVKADIIDIRLSYNYHIKDVDEACTMIVRAIKNVAKLKAMRGGEFQYQLRFICSKKIENESWTDYRKYHLLTEILECKHCAKLFENFNFHQHFKIAVENEKVSEDPLYSIATIVTADDAYMLAKEISDIEEAKQLSICLSEEAPFPSSRDPLWYDVFNIIMKWRKTTEDPSKQALVQKLLLKNDTELFKRLARKLDIETYSAMMHMRY